MDEFVLITPGRSDSNTPGLVRINPKTYERIYALKCETGLSMCRIIEQCVDYALDHLRREE